MAEKSGSTPINKWSAKVTRESDALSLEKGVFTWKDPKAIAQSLKDSAEASTRRKAEPFRSAMSMLVFYINRAGKTSTLTNSAFRGSKAGIAGLVWEKLMGPRLQGTIT